MRGKVFLPLQKQKYLGGRLKMATGLFEILNTITGKRYVAGSTRMATSYKDTIKKLYYIDHPCSALQNEYDEYWLDHAIVMNVLAVCTKAELIETELAYLTEWKDDPLLLNVRGEDGIPIGESIQAIQLAKLSNTTTLGSKAGVTARRESLIKRYNSKKIGGM